MVLLPVILLNAVFFHVFLCYHDVPWINISVPHRVWNIVCARLIFRYDNENQSDEYIRAKN